MGLFGTTRKEAFRDLNNALKDLRKELNFGIFTEKRIFNFSEPVKDDANIKSIFNSLRKKLKKAEKAAKRVVISIK